MEQSLYQREVQKYFSDIAAAVNEKINGSANKALRRYRYKEMLTKKFSLDLTWQSLTTLNSAIVMADVIALDSSLPLKKRDSLGKTSGEIPKLGQERALREKQLTDLMILAAMPNQEAQLIEKIFEDTAKVIAAVPETLEYMFLLGLSTGVTLIADANNVGTAIRVPFGYLAANQFGVPVVWSNTASTPLADINTRILAKAQADGNRITKVMLDRTTFNNIIKTTEAKNLFAFSIGFTGTTLQQPNVDQINTVVASQYGYTFDIVERSTVAEKNGVRTTLTPWQAGMVVALTSNIVGSEQWSTLAEMAHPVPGVNYTTVDDHTLVSKFRLNRPNMVLTDNDGLLRSLIVF